MRLLLDTNTLISARFWRGTPFVLFTQIENLGITLVTSESLIQEFHEVLARPKFAKYIKAQNKTPDEIIQRHRNTSLIVQPTGIPPDMIRDPKDEAVLACALGGKVDYIVSGDDDLLTLKIFEGIPIITARECLDLLTQE